MTATFSEAVQRRHRERPVTLKPEERPPAPLAAVAAAVSYDAASRVATLKPSAGLAANTPVHGHTDRRCVRHPGRGQQPTGDRVLDLHHGGGRPPADTTAPTVTTRTPSSNATSVSRTANITATFSEPVNGVGGYHVHAEERLHGAPITAAVSRDGTTNRVDHSTQLDPRVEHPVHRHRHGGATAIRDAAGNPLTPTTPGASPPVARPDRGRGDGAVNRPHRARLPVRNVP